MCYPSNTKIEERAIGALRNLIDEHLTMGAQFNTMDKEMAWDGYIYIYKINNGDQSKNNLDDKVPVQIKGHIDKEEKYYYYNYDCFYKQIDSADVNSYTLDSLNHTALRLIQAYDISGDEKLLDIAEYQLKKIEEFEKDKIYYIINMLQIIKRRGSFNNKEIMILKGLDTGNLQEKFGINVLLEDKKKARIIYNQMKQEEQKFISKYPIFYLYQNL